MKTNKYYDRLNEIREQYPELTFDNDGYQYLSPEIKEKHKKQIDEISEILKKTVPGFERFDHFKPSKKYGFTVRLQCNYNHGTKNLPFTGVDYIPLEKFKNLDDD
jgi:hypothetical protein